MHTQTETCYTIIVLVAPYKQAYQNGPILQDRSSEITFL